VPLDRSIQTTTDIGTPDSYVVKGLGDPVELYVRSYIYIPAAGLATMQAEGDFNQPNLVSILDGSNVFQEGIMALYDGGGPGWQWWAAVGGSPVGVVDPDTWYKLDFRINTSTVKMQFWVDDVDPQGEFTGNTYTSLDSLRVGFDGGGSYNIDTDLHFTGVAVGSTRGGSDIFDGDVT